MSHLPMVEPNDEPPELKAVFDQLRQTRGRVPGMYRMLAHQPAILTAHRAYFHAALDTGELPRSFKEQVAFKVARLRESAYCSGSHRSYARKHGVSAARLDEIDRGDYSGLDARGVAAMALAEAMVGRRKRIANAVLAGLMRNFSLNEIVELIALVGIMELACSFADVYDLEPD
jgi:AhpD family alkylhydroperoxidase